MDSTILEYFSYLSSVPHGSKNTKQISDLVVLFAKEHGLDYYQDDYNNVIVYKKASKGCENKETISFQAHLDMVCAKNDISTKDLSKEPITLKNDGEYIWAENTSLGGDDISGCAMMLAILDDENIKHPALECIFTVDEEIGMLGAHYLDASKIHGKKLINIDSEDENTFIAGCAGGIRANCLLNVKRDDICGKDAESFCQLEIAVEGLTGGHSGVEIYRERANANILMGRILAYVSKSVPFRISDFYGGKFDNAITKSSFAKVVIGRKDMLQFGKSIEEIEKILKKEYFTTDPELSVKATVCTMERMPVTFEDTKKIIGLVNSLPNGVQSRCPDLLENVETSLNLGILYFENDTVNMCFAIRSSVKSRKDMLAEKVQFIVNAFGGKVELKSEYPAWEFKKESAFRDKLLEVYKKHFGRDAIVEITHAGLECGIFCGKIPDLECVSIGPNILDIHTAQEKMEIASVKRVYEMMVDFLSEF